MQWTHHKIEGGGQKWVLWHSGARVGAAVRLPGTLTRVYFQGEIWGDYPAVRQATERLAALAQGRWPQAETPGPAPLRWPPGGDLMNHASDGGVFVLTVIDRESDDIAHQELFSERPTFGPEETGYELDKVVVCLTHANVNGGDHAPLVWDGERWI